MLTPAELRELSKPSAARSALSLALDWGGIVALFALAILVPHPAVYVVCFLGLSRQQLALAILMHDAAHKRLFASPKANDWTGQFLCAAPLLFSVFSYRTLHLKHHRDPLAPDDPDLSLIGGYPIAAASFRRKLLRDAFGVSYVKFIRYFIHMARPRPKPPAASPASAKGTGGTGRERAPVGLIAFSILAVNGAMIATLVALGHGWLYLFLWLLPAITALQVLLRIRGVAEHAGYVQGEDQRLNARTVVNPAQAFLFAPHNVNFHIEHHVYPSIPYFRLPRAHRLMSERGSLPEPNVYRSYAEVLREIVK